jgi:hypothetical protein
MKFKLEREKAVGRKKESREPALSPSNLTIEVVREQLRWDNSCELCRHGRAEPGMRHSTQLEGLKSLPDLADGEHPLRGNLLFPVRAFEPDSEPDSEPDQPLLEWAYHRCRFAFQGDLGTPDSKTLWFELDDINVQSPEPLYLFNILVALEWRADEDYLQQLRWAFRRASDHLYDLTEGRMAFGQVIFGGPELMSGADIQIMASNRLHPRSWVEGLHNPHKYTPVRLGRELWSARNRVAYSWLEPEGYRTLVHEWLHYAVCLKDGYLTTRKHAVEGEPVPFDIRIPTAPAFIDSATQDTSISELSPQDQMAKIKKKLACYFPDLLEADWNLKAGPHRLPVTLPLFEVLPSLKEGTIAPLTLDFTNLVQSVRGLEASSSQMDARAARAERHPPTEFTTEQQNLLHHCWVYVLRGAPGQDAEGYTCLIPQGTLGTLRSTDQSFQLLGAEPHDTVVIVLNQPGQGMEVVRQTIDANGKLTGGWQPIQLDPLLPVITVLPLVSNAATNASGTVKAPDKREIRVQVTGSSLPRRLWVFPFGQEFSKDEQRGGAGSYARSLDVPQGGGLTDTLEVPTLDGHILAEWAPNQLLIYPFSQGGGPPNHEPVGSSPVTAGSTDGKLMLFFYHEEDEGANSNPCAPEPAGSRDYLKMIATMSYGDLAEPCAEQPQATVASYIYGLSATEVLNRDLTPTLIFFYDRPLEGPGSDFGHVPMLYRLDYDASGAPCWKRLGDYCYSRLHSPYVAVPLTGATAPALFGKNGKQVDHYRLYWEPR